MSKKITLRYYLLAALYYGGLNMTSAMFMTFLLMRGLDERSAMIAYAFYFVALTSIEIPTGAGSDVGGRKNAFMLACTLSATSMIVYSFSESFWTFALAATLGGFGAAFANGTLDSWFATQMRYNGGEQSLDLAFTWVEIFKTIIAAVSGFVGIRFAGDTMQFPWFAATTCFLGAGLVAWQIMHEQDFASRERTSFRKKWKAWKQTAHDGMAYGRDNKKIRFLVLAVAALYATMMIPNMLWQPHFLQWLPDKESLGYIWLASMAASGLGMLLVMVPRLLGYEMYDRKTLLICLGVIGTGMIGMASFGDLRDSLIPYLLFYQCGRGASQPISRAFLHRNISSDQMRTTVASIEAIGHHIGAATGLIIGAHIVLFFSRETALISAGAFILLFAVFRWKHRKSS